MNLGDILHPQAVKTISACTSKKRLFHDLGELRQPVDLVFALLAPKAHGVEHLKALALVSRTMRDPDICAKLRANSDAATIHAILTEQHQATQAA